MKPTALALVVALSGCGIVPEVEIIAGVKACESHGGLRSMWVTRNALTFDATCKDGVNITGLVKAAQ